MLEWQTSTDDGKAIGLQSQPDTIASIPAGLWSSGESLCVRVHVSSFFSWADRSISTHFLTSLMTSDKWRLRERAGITTVGAALLSAGALPLAATPSLLHLCVARVQLCGTESVRAYPWRAPATSATQKRSELPELRGSEGGIAFSDIRWRVFLPFLPYCCVYADSFPIFTTLVTLSPWLTSHLPLTCSDLLLHQSQMSACVCAYACAPLMSWHLQFDPTGNTQTSHQRATLWLILTLKKITARRGLSDARRLCVICDNMCENQRPDSLFSARLLNCDY